MGIVWRPAAEIIWEAGSPSVAGPNELNALAAASLEVLQRRPSD